jgi:ribonuclease P protein component
MLSSLHRFHGRSSLRYVYQRGQTARDRLVAVRYALNDRQTSYRVAVVVSRKVSKSAVVRNRIRRRLYEIVRNASSGIQKPYDIVFTVYGEEAASVPAPLLKKIILGQLVKAGILASPDKDRGILDEKENKT